MNTEDSTIRLPPFTIDYKQLPRLFCFSLGAITALLISTLVFELRMATLTNQQNQNYGAALARMAAQQAVDATLNHDLVSLQVILQDVVANPGAVLATIHDVENNLLVQAGDAQAVQISGIPVEAHTTPITLHDSIAGYVTVTLRSADNHRGAVLGTVAIITLLLAAVAGLTLHEQRKKVFVRRVQTADDRQPDHESIDGEDEWDEDTAGSRQLLTIYARIRIFNRQALEQQLSAEAFEATMADLDHLVDDVLALYSGQRSVNDSGDGQALMGPDEYLLQFNQTPDDAEAPFRAICCSYLLIRLAGLLRPISLTLGAEISVHPAPMTTEPRLASELAIQQVLAEQVLLQKRLKLAELPEHPEHVRLEDFQNPFAALLERQYQQLKQVWS